MMMPMLQGFPNCAAHAVLTAGNPVNRAGIETDDFFRPLGPTGSVFHPRLYASGSILAHQDWKREKSGSGIAIASAFKAVSHIVGK
jgi:glycerol-3-phosphate dehydrogenase subunit B